MPVSYTSLCSWRVALVTHRGVEMVIKKLYDFFKTAGINQRKVLATATPRILRSTAVVPPAAGRGGLEINE